ncbi:hypothetical protein D3C75_1006410 [compost metagenome]
MPGHQVSADFIVKLGGSFQIDHITQFKIAKIGQPQSFFDQIKADAIACNLRDGQTAAVVGHRGPQLQPW